MTMIKVSVRACECACMRNKQQNNSKVLSLRYGIINTEFMSGKSNV